MRLKDGLAWSLPVTLSVDEEKARELSENSEIALVDGTGEPVATMVLRELYGYDKEKILLRTESAIAPHGGELIDRVVPEAERRERSMEAAELPKVPLSPRALSDLQMISTGVFSPLEGFMLCEEYESVVRTCA